MSLWWWAGNVFGPARVLRRAGVYSPKELGKKPVVSSRPRDRGRDLSRRIRRPRLLRRQPDGYDTVEGFDECSQEYQEVVRPFSMPIFHEALDLLRPLLGRGPRVLDPSCGPGEMTIELAKQFPEGEVVACDLSKGMVLEAHKRARAERLTNMAFFQADVARPPPEFRGYFDAIFCCLSFHHYPDAEGAARAMAKVLRKGGLVCIADPGPDWFIALSRAVSVAGDPGFVRHRNGKEFTKLFSDAGFSSVWWTEALPGVGVTIARR